MKDVNPIKVHQSRKANDLTFTGLTVIRPGSLDVQTPNANRHPRIKHYIEPSRLKKVRLVTPVTIVRPTPALTRDATPRPRRTSYGQPLEASKPGLMAAAARIISAYGMVIVSRNWRALISDKHKRYTVHGGVKIQPTTFRTQTAALVVAAVLLLGTAQSMAPSSPAVPVMQPTPLTVVSPAQLSNAVRSDGDQAGSSDTTSANAATAASSPSSGVRGRTAENGTGTGGVQVVIPPSADGASNGTDPAPGIVPGMGGGDSAPVVIPTVPTEPKPPIKEPVPDKPVEPLPPSSPLDDVVDNVTGTLQGVTNKADSLL